MKEGEEEEEDDVCWKVGMWVGRLERIGEKREGRKGKGDGPSCVQQKEEQLR